MKWYSKEGFPNWNHYANKSKALLSYAPCTCINYILSRPPRNGDDINSYYLLPELLQYPPNWASYFYLCTLRRHSSHSSWVIFVICKLGHVFILFKILQWLHHALKIKSKLPWASQCPVPAALPRLLQAPGAHPGPHSPRTFALGAPDVAPGSGPCLYVNPLEADLSF